MNKTIIIADDNSALCGSIREFIDSQDGYEVVGVASNGVKAIELVNAYQPDFLILDIVMPELDGFGVLSALEGRKPTVIMMSQLATDGFVQKAMQLGASYFLQNRLTTTLFCELWTVFQLQTDSPKREKTKTLTNESQIFLFPWEFPLTSKVISF